MSWKDKIRNADCELCPLHEDAEHVCLMGSGKRSARVMLVGEAPGRREDEEHRAFVGPSGKLLDELLGEAGLKRSDCYITNVNKCRPPNNRTPKKPEIKVCTETYLAKEIERVAPEVIVVLGNSALQGVLGKSGIKKHRGSVVQLGDDGPQVLATLHPAAGLRNPYMLPEIRADFQRLGRLIRGESEKLKTKIKVVRTKKQLATLRRILMNAEEIAWDLETYTFDNGVRLKGKKVTTNFQEWRGPDLSVIACISFSWEAGVAAVVPLWHEKTPWSDPEIVLQFLKPAMERKDCKYIAHNGKFDCRWLASRKIFCDLTFDTMLAAHMLDENRSKGLKPLSQVHLGVDAYDIGEDVANAYHAPLQRLCTYAGKDAAFTLHLYHIFREELKQVPRTARIFKLMMMPSSNMFTKIERRGCWIDPDKLATNTEVAHENVEKIKGYMYKYVPEAKQPKPVPAGATKKLTKELAGINFNSPDQIAEWLFRDLDLPVIELTDTEKPSSKESVLIQLSRKHPAIKGLLKYRKWAKYLDTYLMPLDVKHRDEQSRIHPTFKLSGTVTGRLSCTEPNLQNIPRNPFLRGVVGAPPGWKLIEADYSQIELRIAAQLAGETKMLRAFHEGRDVHMETAVELTGKIPSEVTSEERKLAKAVNFGFLYGMGWEKFIEYARDNYEVHVTEAEAKAYRAAFFRKWPRLLSWHDRQRRLVERYERVQSPIGRVRHLPDVHSGDRGVRSEAERQAINSPVQSFASDLMLMSALQLDSCLDPRECFIVGSIHDALLFQSRDDSVEASVEVVRREMLNPPIKRWFGATLDVPIEVEIKVGQHWGEGKVVPA